MQKESRKESRNKNVRRISSSYNPDTYERLHRMAAACGISPTSLQSFWVDLCMNNESIINYTQDYFRDKSLFRIIPTRIDGELNYIFAEKIHQKNAKER